LPLPSLSILSTPNYHPDSGSLGRPWWRRDGRPRGQRD
jgi:hypothetical protein